MITDETDPVLVAAADFIAAESGAVAQVAASIDDVFLDVAARLYACTGKVIVSGVGTSGFMARRAAHLFSVSGTPAVFIHPTEGMHGSVGALRAGDIVIVMSKGGSSSEVNTFVALAQAEGVQVIAITSLAESRLAELADVTAVLPVDSITDPGGVIAMGSTLAHSSWLDAMAYVLMRARGYSWDRVLFTHPGGAVGQVVDLPAPLPGLTISGASAPADS